MYCYNRLAHLLEVREQVGQVMHSHANAALTRTQRRLVRELAAQVVSDTELARRFGVHRRTIERWRERDEPTDQSSAPRRHGRKVVTDEYERAVITHRTEHPHHGPKRIAHHLRHCFPSANVATVWRVLKAAGLSKRAPKKTPLTTDQCGEASGTT